MRFKIFVKKKKKHTPQNSLVSRHYLGIRSLIIFLVNSDLHLNYKLRFASVNLQCSLKKKKNTYSMVHE